MAKTKDFSNRFSPNAISALGFMGIKVPDTSDSETTTEQEIPAPSEPINATTEQISQHSSADKSIQSETISIDKPSNIKSESSDISNNEKSPVLNDTADMPATIAKEDNILFNNNNILGSGFASPPIVSRMYTHNEQGTQPENNQNAPSTNPSVNMPVDPQSGRSRPRSQSVIGRGAKRVRVSLLLSEELTDALSDLSYRYNLSRNEVINRILMNYVKEHIND